MKKEEVRRSIKAQKALLDATEKAQAAQRVFAELEQTAAFMLAQNILMYHSLPDELSTIDFIEKWHKRKHFFLPRVNGVNLDILPYERTRLSLGAFQIEEPQGDDIHSADEMELIIVPAIAYDRAGNRVGRGKGYYDRLLASTKATKIGVGYHFQLVQTVDAEDHDVPVDIVITDREVLHIHPRNKKQ